MPLRGLSGAKRCGLVRTVGRGALAVAGLLVTALAPEEPDIAPPVGVSQVESLAWRKHHVWVMIMCSSVIHMIIHHRLLLQHVFQIPMMEI